MAIAILNKNQETDNVIIFIHIPKTGGSTLHSIIYNEYTMDNSIKDAFSQIYWNSDISDEEKKRIEFISGHQNFGIHRSLPHNNYIYITMLRNPIELVISFYYYVRYEKAHEFYNLFNKITLYEFATKEEFNYITCNLQTRYLSQDDNDDLESAKYNLKNYFSIVGITERFDDTVYLLEKKLDFKVNNYENLNINPQRPSTKEISRKIIEIIEKKNKSDINLYHYANKLLDAELEQLKS